MLSKKVLLHHGIVRPHTVAATVDTVQHLGSVKAGFGCK